MEDVWRILLTVTLIGGLDSVRAQSLLSRDSSGMDLREVLLPIAVTVGVVAFSLLLFLYYICRLRKKQGKPICCCYHNNKETRSRKDVDTGYRCCGYTPLATETEAKSTAHAQSGTVNASFEVEGTSEETLGNHNTPHRARIKGNLKQSQNNSKNSNQTNKHNANSRVCETCSKYLQITCEQNLCAAQQSPCQRCKDSNVV